MENILEQEGVAPVGSSFRRVGECLYQNPSSGTYYAVVRLNGKQFKSSLETKSLPEARRKLRDYRKDLNRLDPAQARLTVKELCDKFLATVTHQAAGTVRQKKEICGRIKREWGEVRARDLKKSQILTWLSSFEFGAHSYNKYLRTIRAIMALAVDDHILSASPLDGVKEVRTPKPIRHTPSFAEFQAIVASIREQNRSADESADLAEFMGFAGLGQAETSSLTWGDVNLEKGQIVTFRHKTKQGFAIPIFPQLRPLLVKRLALATAADAGNPPSVGTRVFSVTDPRRAIEAACERLKLPHYTSRSLRRLFITTAIERGVDVKVIAQWQGHRDGGKLILDTYSHVRPVHSEQMARLMTLEPVTNKEKAETA
jgi:integrase